MSRVMQPERPFSGEEQIWKLIYEVAGSKEFTSECESALWELVQNGVQRLKFEFGTGDSARALEVKENYKLLIETMKEKAGTERNYLDQSDLDHALKSICPLFPIC